MKKILFTSAVALALIACGGSDKEKKDTATTETKSEAAEAAATTPAPSDNPDYEKGLALVAGSDCLTCHKVDEKVIGPSYREVANKYENTEANVKLLAEKIVKGGAGVWGEVQMTPHPAVTQADAEQMVKYILLLKK
ncbi:c-type cytochrome [Lacibacter luteus]|uniref:C-type cytochrome n=1 Tax=Lacibacter luteus TaxID=2508719 RepID=A0A4V1M7Q6_9BACT|nr:c-type cytochrome [Lacibacter luteus]RXK60905.1 c-type cytochrome [Lacibacter luteus]